VKQINIILCVNYKLAIKKKNDAYKSWKKYNTPFGTEHFETHLFSIMPDGI